MTTCPGPKRTPLAIVCSWPPSSKPREISSKARPKPRARAVNRVPRGLRQTLRQLTFTRRRKVVTARPYGSLPSAENEQLATRDRGRTQAPWRPAPPPPGRKRKNPADRTRDGLPRPRRQKRPRLWHRPGRAHAPANTTAAERQSLLPQPDWPRPHLPPPPR